jgi:hypothetical protein
MLPSLAIAAAFVVAGIIVTVALPGAGLVIGVVLIVLAAVMLLGSFAAGRRRAPAPRP